jgi:hypothetical protein
MGSQVKRRDNCQFVLLGDALLFPSFARRFGTSRDTLIIPYNHDSANEAARFVRVVWGFHRTAYASLAICVECWSRFAISHFYEIMGAGP